MKDFDWAGSDLPNIGRVGKATRKLRGIIPICRNQPRKVEKVALK
jgi:hypothetical protein